MEEPSATTQVSTSRDLSSEIKSFGNDCSYGSSKDTIGVSIPVCYLIKEQAKAHIAIQDLQKRLTQVENVQENVVDAIIEFRNYLCDTKSFNSTNPLMTSKSLSTSRSPSAIVSKLNSVSKSKENYVPSAADSSVEVSHLILKSRSYSSKDCDHRISDYEKGQAVASVPELSQKQLDLIKSKDAALESDKQDSGLDSDCREHHEIHPSIIKCIPSSANQDANDELLQLLDEINYRSTILQKQLAIAEDVTTLSDLIEMTARSRNGKNDSRSYNCPESKLSFLETSRNGLMHDQCQQPRLTPPSICEDAGEKVPITLKPNGSIAGLLEGKLLCDRRPPMKKATNSIDSSVVSSILKETNVVDLQRQALIYLVDNAVLNTKLREAEHSLSSKHIESEKVENALKEEARLLMMENRELRISLDEQRMENTSLKSRLVMLEKVVQSVSNENQELNWQLSESLNIQNFPKRGSLSYSSGFRSENPVNASRSSGRRPSFPVNTAAFHNDRNINCVRSKLLTNNSSFLDVTAEDPNVDSAAFSSSAAFRFRNKPIHSSTPMMPSQQKQRETETFVSKSPHLSDTSPANFHSVKKCLKTSYTADQGNTSPKISKSGRCLEESYSTNIPETYAKKFSQNLQDDTLPLEGAGKFPFNTILEKLKSNSEYRLSKSASAKTGELSSDNSEPSQGKSPVNSSKAGSLQDGGNISHFKEAKSSQESADVILQRKKGRNIQQRIQNILDRIVAESEEAS
ncbi:uncharacterized protein LOC129963914 [Argiope bruennichi]|uniref:Uncharacterized protein n=1 Tax=Argiope bruennichi TaxID=94029 RepID=A0A8T0ETF8_ARGBR|nr:uncharacterized protein LOC129963914 [Argiope bruennichi]KAF8781360.1 hypothetical protein HNY73_011762 [Argiope bruennichi]